MHLSGLAICSLRLQTDSQSPCVPELSISTEVQTVTVQQRPSTKEQETTAPDIWSIKQDQEKKTAFVSLIAVPLAGARRHHSIRLTIRVLAVSISAEMLSNKQV